MKGFSLIELIVSMSIFTILVAIASPHYSTWIAAIKLKNTSENINMALTQARAEAIVRKTHIEFILYEDKSWIIKTAKNDEIINKQITDSHENITEIITYPEKSSLVTFNGLGLIHDNSNNTSSIETIDIVSKKQHQGVNSLRIIINDGSNYLCNPNQANPNNFTFCR